MTPLILAVTAVQGRLLAESPTGLAWIDSNPDLTWYGDLRLRYELDWDSQNSAGVGRDDRHRGRVRARAGFNYLISDEFSMGVRVRAGDSRSQQSPHLTFATDDGTSDDLDFVLDRYFVQFKHDGITGWGGRNTSPFWYQNELFWDEDVTPTGIAGNYGMEVGGGTLNFIGGAFHLPDGGYDLNGRMLAGQVKYATAAKPSQFTFAAGLHHMSGESGAGNLLNRNGDRDYLIGVASGQWSIPVRQVNDTPFTLGADLFYNFENYSALDVAPFPASDADEVFGFVFSATLGRLAKKHDWLVGYYYSHIETFSVNASYAQDDWVRFGTGPQTNGSDFEGHEIRLGCAVSDSINLVARFYFVEAITTVQDGNRFRLDLNWKF